MRTNVRSPNISADSIFPPNSMPVGWPLGRNFSVWRTLCVCVCDSSSSY